MGMVFAQALLSRETRPSLSLCWMVLARMNCTRSDPNFSSTALLPNAVGGLHHGLVILDFEGMPLKWVQLRQRNFLYLLQLGILAAFLGGKQIIVWSQLYFFRAAFQVLSPPWSDSYSPRPPCH